MKIVKIDRLRTSEPNRPDVYTVRSPRDTITVIDSDENILDLFPRTAVRYTISEAEQLMEFLKTTWGDYKEDPYYKQGKPIYPIYQSPKKYDVSSLEIAPFSPAVIAYRYKLAGEFIYGITNKWADFENDGDRAVEAPMDGWEKWLKDRKAMLRDKWTAENVGNL